MPHLTIPDAPILVGIAADDRSDPAVKAALDLAHRSGRAFELLHVVDDSGLPSVDTAAAVPEIRAALARRLADAVGSEAAVHLRVETGRPIPALLERARDAQVGLILLGPHQRSGLLDLGRTARAVLTHAPCPVWVQSRWPRTIRRVLAAVDLSEDSRAAALWAREFAWGVGAELTLLHVFDPPVLMPALAITPGNSPTAVPSLDHVRGEDHEAFERFAREIDADAEVRFERGLPARRILEQDDVDLVVMASHGRGAISAALVGSVTTTVLKNSDLPVVAIRHANRQVAVEASGDGHGAARPHARRTRATTPPAPRSPMTHDDRPRHDSTRQAIDALTAQGYTHQFTCVDGQLRCEQTGDRHDPAAFRIDREERFEGATDPQSQVLVLALSHTERELRGTLVVPYGPGADAAEADVLSRLARVEVERRG